MSYTGVYTALVTPFKKNGSIDEPALRSLIEWQIESGIDGLVPVGTTGESPTLTHGENIRVVELVIHVAKGRCKVIAGTGANATDEAVYMTRKARKAGADATLQVVPYYNKPTQEGIYQHFRVVVEKGGLPVIIYDIPGRTGVSIANETIMRLHKEYPGSIVGLKEASGNVDRVSLLRQMLPQEFSILSGDDSLTLPMMSIGAVGVISVASNVLPIQVTSMVHAALSGDFAKAQVMHAKLFPIFKDLFIETNPIPVKAALAMCDRIKEVYRLPLVPMSATHRQQLQHTLHKSKCIRV